MINKNTENTNLSWNPNWVNHKYFLLLQNYILQIVSSCYYRQGWYYTLFTNNYWKEAMTPWFISYYWKDSLAPYLLANARTRLWSFGLSTTTEDASTPYLPATTGRRLRPSYRLVSCPSTSQPPLYYNLISDCSSINLSIEFIETPIRRFKTLFIYPQTYIFIQQSPIFIVTLHTQIN